MYRYRYPVSYTPTMQGGRLVRIQHINGCPVELKRLAHNRREYVTIHGKGIDLPQSHAVMNNNHVFGDLYNQKQMLSPGVRTSGGSIKNHISKERILREIASSMSGRKKR